MITNHLKIAWRTMLKRKAFSSINIFGLAIGLAIFTLITLFVLDELSYDRFHENASRIYRINTNIKVNGTGFNDRSTPAPMSSVLLSDFPQVEKAVRVYGGGDMLVKKGDETLVENDVFFADSTLFSVFTIPMLVGNPRTALSGTNSMVISATIAKKYFNSLDVLGKSLQVDNGTNYTITGVIEDIRAQSHFHFSFIRSMGGEQASRSDFWLSNSFNTYVLLRDGVDQATLDSYLKQTAQKYAEPQLMEAAKTTIAELEKKGDYFRYSSIPLTDIHLKSELSELEPAGNIQYVYISAIIGLIILIIACINFMNLSTAQSAGRAKEVGVRKVIGSGRQNLVRQFLTESLLTAVVAFVISGFLAAGLLPLLNKLAGKEIILLDWSHLWLLPALLGVALICGLLAGAYPAFVLSAFDPVQILKGKFVLNIKGYKLRNALVVFQFTTAIILITGTLVIYSQLNYIRSKDLGYNREQVLVLQNARALGGHLETFKNEILNLPGVIAGSVTNNLPTTTANDWNKNAYSANAAMSASEIQTLVDWSADADYIPALQIKMLKGRNFSKDMATDSTAVIINETAVRLFGFKDPLNEKLYDFDSGSGTQTQYHIVGVVKDFNAGSLRNVTEPLLIRNVKTGGRLILRVKSNDIAQLIAQIRDRYRSFEGMSSQPFRYSFLDEDFDNLYHGEQRTGGMFITFAALAIFIACLGLFGLASYSAEQRTKEIGIRKVLGASVNGIIGLLSRDFIALVGIAIVLAVPVSWWAMNQWLNNFAYRIEIDWLVFVISGLTAVAIALFAVSFKAITAALANPVKSLRSE
ncbi:MAG: ABC transporter permease [Bacteroidota bacterium]